MVNNANMIFDLKSDITISVFQAFLEDA